jgi:hypothetical protein
MRFVWLMIACYITSMEYNKYKLVTIQMLYIWCIVVFYPNINKLPEYMTIFNK